MAVVPYNNRLWPRSRLPVMALVLISVLTIIAVTGERHFDLREVGRQESPDGRHLLIILQRPLVFRRPANADEAPGIVVLQRSDGQELKRLRVEKIALLANPQWSTEKVGIAGLLEWPLSD